MTDRFGEPLKKIFELQDRIADIHPLLEQVFPVAVVSGGGLWLYRPEASTRRYRHIGTVPPPFPLDPDVMAAFPLEEMNGEPAAVITEEVFDSLEGHVFIFHEFVHCHQYATCEERLKSGLEVARVGQASQGAMWEIQYPFPYDSPVFIDAYKRQLEGDFEAREALRQGLEKLEHECLVWQEWKEGFARWTENRIRERLELPINKNGTERPYSRVSFYAGGAALIEHLSTQTSGLTDDIETLFRQIRDYPS